MRLGDPSPTLRLLAALTDQRTRPRVPQTGETRGELDEFVVDTLMDFVDKSGDGQVDYNEFTKVLISDDIMSTAGPDAGTSIFSYKKGATAAHRRRALHRTRREVSARRRASESSSSTILASTGRVATQA